MDNTDKSYTLTITGWKAAIFVGVTLYVFIVGTVNLVTSIYHLF